MVVDEIRIDLKKRNVFVFALIALFIVLTLPTFLRFYAGNDSLVGSEPYYHFRAARELLEEGSLNLFSPPKDVPDLSYSPRDYFFNPYHYLLVYASRLVSLQTASRVVPFIMGIASLLLFNLILRRFVGEGYKRHLILLMLVLSPVFIYTFTVSNPHSAAIALTLLGFYLFMLESRSGLLLSALCFVAVSLFSLFNTFLVILLLLAYVLTMRRGQNRFIIIVLVLALFSFAGRAAFFYNYSYAPDVNVFGSFISDLGGLLGFGIFSVVLAVYAVSSGWKAKGRFICFFFLALLLIASLFFMGNVANMYLMFIVAVASGLGFVRLYGLKWNVVAVKNLTLLILICGILFSTTSYLTRVVDLHPDQDALESLDWLGDNAFKDDFVLSHYGEGYLISTVARNPVIADSFASSDYDQEFLYKVQDSMFYGRKLDQTKRLFRDYDVRYIYLTPEMKDGLVWSRPNEGLLFLFTSRSTFEKVYDDGGYEVWEVLNTTIS